jgi:hypothetical protein
MLEAIGHPVDHLKRISIGPIRDHGLKLGRWRDLTESEVTALKKAAAYQSKAAPQKRHEGLKENKGREGREGHYASTHHHEQGRRSARERADGREGPPRRERQGQQPKARPRRQR